MNNFADIVFDNPAVQPDRTALVCGRRSTSYAQLRERAGGVAGLLQEHGLGPGDRAAALMSNRSEYLEIYLGCALAGVALVPLNVRQLPAEQLRIMEDSGARLLFVDERCAASAASLHGALPRLHAPVLVGSAAPGMVDYEAALASRRTWRPVDVGESAPAVLLYTSGTTSLPKGAVITHGNLLANLSQYQAAVGIRGGSVNLQLSPLFHAASIFSFVHFLVGGTTILIDRVDPERIFGAIAEHRVSFMFTVPTVLYSLIDDPARGRHDLSSLELIQYGAAPITGTRLREAIEVFGYRLIHSYGMTESTSHISLLGPDDHRIAEGSVGRPLPGIDLRIAGADGRQCAPGEVGEIRVRGPNVFRGYWNDAEETARTLQGGWLHTGDLGYLDERGFLYIAGRAREMIISGGTNIHPLEIEEAMMRHDAVAEAAVFGLPHPRWGEAVAAAVVLKPGRSTSAEELHTHLRRWLGGYKVPKVLRILDALPRNAAGKVLKRELKAHDAFR